jgi:hypothetical protein
LLQTCSELFQIGSRGGTALPILKSARHEAFAQELAKAKTADEAYEAAGYRPDRGHASRLAANGNICARLAGVQAMGAEKAAVTVNTLIAEAEAARVLAMENGQISAAVSALITKAKLAGLWDRPAPLAQTALTGPFIDRPPAETYEQWLERRRRDGHGARDHREVGPLMKMERRGQ